MSKIMCAITDCLDTSQFFITSYDADGGLRELQLCTAHHRSLLAQMGKRGMVEDDIILLSNAEIEALISNNEFKMLIARLVDEQRFRKIIRERSQNKREDKCDTQ